MNELDTHILEALQHQLEQDEISLLATLKGLENASATVELDQSSVGRVSRMDAMQQQAMAQAERQKITMKLKAIKSALKKISSDDFGYCEQCDDLIQLARLKVKPETPYCLACQEKLEKN